jgi:glucosamine--fructose-6-phosphate aminotransferase (isomerizing)
VVLAARGTSDHVALYAKYLIETRLGLPCALASMSTMMQPRVEPRLQRTLWIAISQSGSSPDLLDSTATAGRGGAMTLAVTNSPDSELATAARMQIDIRAGAELSVAATKTYTAQLQAMWLLIDAWQGGDGSAAARVPALLRDALDSSEVGEVVSRYRFIDRLVTVGRGFSYPTARECALKLMETSYVAAQAFSGADFLHGPVAMVNEDLPVMVIAPEGRSGDLLRPVLTHLNALRADVCLVGSTRLAQEFKVSAHVPVPSPDDDSLTPLIDVLPLQRLALGMAAARRLDPDTPRGLRKVTLTR